MRRTNSSSLSILLLSLQWLSLYASLETQAHPFEQQANLPKQTPSPQISFKDALSASKSNSAIYKLDLKDSCSTQIREAKLHGYEVQEFKVVTADDYELKLHRIVHPTDFATNGPAPNTKKPYLLLHGLIGSSASFLRNVEPNYQAPLGGVFDAQDAIDEIIKHHKKSNEYTYDWRSAADKFKSTHEAGTKKPTKSHAKLNVLDFGGDSTNFGLEFNQAYRIFDLPTTCKPYISQSLAFTLSNFGYDVWLLNLRGNHFSKGFNGCFNHKMDEYWDFNINSLIKDDLLASINMVRKVSQAKYQMGVVAYSYSNLFMLGLLTKYPQYQNDLQPVIMMAPASMNGSKKRGFKLFMKSASAALLSSNGPFPAVGRQKKDRIERLVCSLPIASEMCRFMETMLLGESKSVSKMIFSDRKKSLVRDDTKCGQTSKAVLHGLIKNLSDKSIDPNFQPFVQARRKIMSGSPVRRSVLLLHSTSDDIGELNDVKVIRDSALKLMALADVELTEANFGHTDFLFSQRNQYLVNAEIARMASVFDYMVQMPWANRPKSRN